MKPPLALMAATRADAAPLALLETSCQTHPWTVTHFERSTSEAASGRETLVFRGPSDPGDPLRGIVAYCVTEVVLDEAHVHNLGVREDLRRRGLARRLLREALRVAFRRGARSAYLEVRRSNLAALALYQGLGFQEVGTRRGYYRQPDEDALVLRCESVPGTAADPS